MNHKTGHTVKQSSTGARLVIRGGNLTNTANVSPAYVNVNNELGNANANIGSRLAEWLSINDKSYVTDRTKVNSLAHQALVPRWNAPGITTHTQRVRTQWSATLDHTQKGCKAAPCYATARGTKYRQ